MRISVALPLLCLTLQSVLVVQAFVCCEFDGSRNVSTRWRRPRERQSLLKMRFFGFSEDEQSKITKDEMVLLEKQVQASAQAQIDRTNAKKAILDPYPQQQALVPPPWAAAVAASVASGSVAFFTLQSLPLAVIAALGVAFVASRNPLEEKDNLGAVARTVGRYTIASVEAATPKAKAMARAALTGEEELVQLKQRLQYLEEENVQLKLWKKRRVWVDRELSSYNLQDLKQQARESGIQVGGTKSQLLMRLVEANVIDPDFTDLDI